MTDAPRPSHPVPERTFADASASGPTPARGGATGSAPGIDATPPELVAHAGLFEACRDGVLIVTKRDHRIAYANPAARSMIAGGTDVVGDEFGDPIDGSEVDLVGGERVAELRVSDVALGDDPAWLVVLRDVSDRIAALHEARDERRALDRALAHRDAAQRRQDLLIDELNHRVKNTLAIVQSVVARTLRANDVDDAVAQTLLGRLQAIARAQDLLTHENWGSVALGDVVRRAVEPFRTGNGTFSIGGPVVPLAPKAGVLMTMALHELATNATKHGALRTGGRIAVSWSIDRETTPPTLRFAWRESGVGGLRPPSRRGFGSTLIERGLANEMGGTATLRFETDGVAYDLAAPVRDRTR